MPNQIRLMSATNLNRMELAISIQLNCGTMKIFILGI